MGKKRIIAETGAGQHGVATATVCALMDMPCVVYQGALDVERQHTNVERMKMLGAEVRPVKTGNWTLKDATNKVNMGSEPLSNTIWGLNINWKKQSPR